MAVAPSWFGIEDTGTAPSPERAYGKGKLDFTLKGENLHGGWIVTRMRKQEGEKRTNWLLIKYRDEFAREGKKNRILDEDTSVASSRSMDEITAGKGRGPKPLVTAKKSRASAKVEWKSRRATARASSAKKRSRPVATRTNAKEKEGDCRSKHAALHRASIMFFGGAPSVRQRLGPRDQIRRLPHSDAD
jgi:bifunctional non-homologous end joining protein LigD